MRQLDNGGDLSLNPVMSVLTIQSRVASGYVGNSIAIPCFLQLGIDAVAIDTTMLSNHPAHGAFRGRVVPPEEIDELLLGVVTRTAPESFDAMLSGYLGTTEAGPSFLRVAATRRPGALYCLDPVLGDNGRLYVNEDLVSFFQIEALSDADIITPNAFEAGILLGRESCTLDNAAAIISELLKRGPSRVAVTGIVTPEGLATLAADATGIRIIETPRIEVAESGAGDAFAALLLGRLLTSERSFADAAAVAASSLYDILTLTRRLGKDDLAIVDGLAFLKEPSSQFTAEPFQS
jgi:pyridoxine kinase